MRGSLRVLPQTSLLIGIYVVTAVTAVARPEIAWTNHGGTLSTIRP
jgi:hypothetical protein